MAPVRQCIKRNLLFRFGAKHLSTLPAKMTLTQCRSNAGPQSATLAQHQTSIGSTPCVCWAAFNPVNTKHYCSVSFVECFGMFWKSKKLQVRDYLFKWTKFFRKKYVRSWVVGLPNHPQLRNYMTRHYDSFYTTVMNKRWPYVVLISDQRRRQWPRMKYKPVVTSPFITPGKH